MLILVDKSSKSESYTEVLCIANSNGELSCACCTLVQDYILAFDSNTFPESILDWLNSVEQLSTSVNMSNYLHCEIKFSSLWDSSVVMRERSVLDIPHCFVANRDGVWENQSSASLPRHRV